MHRENSNTDPFGILPLVEQVVD